MPPRAGVRITLGLDAPRARPHLNREPSASSSKFPSRSRASRARRLNTCSPGRGIQCTDICRCPSQRRIHTTTRLGITPRHCSANSPGEAIPATVRRCAAGSGTTLWRYATYSRTADALHPRKRTAKPSKGRRTTTPRLCKDNAVTSGRRDRSPPSPSALCDHRRRPQRHPGHCITILDVVEACGDGTPPRQLLHPRTASRQWHPRVLTRAVDEQETSTPPPSKPLLGTHKMRHDAPPEARFARTAVYSTTLYTIPLHVDEIVWHACNLLPPWPIKGGAVP
jgi:hypothetical protein